MWNAYFYTSDINFLKKTNGYKIIVPYFGARSLDMDLDFSRYWHFYGTITDIRTNRNPYKRGTTNHLRQICDA